jgi:hypothetical protein
LAKHPSYAHHSTRFKLFGFETDRKQLKFEC